MKADTVGFGFPPREILHHVCILHDTPAGNVLHISITELR